MKEILQNEQMIRQKLTEALQKENEAFWLKRLEERNMGRLHVAVMTEPYFSLVLAGKKTMESRFSQRKIAPWGKVAAGDTVILKKSGGGYAGIFEAGSVQFLQPKNITVRKQPREKIFFTEPLAQFFDKVHHQKPFHCIPSGEQKGSDSSGSSLSLQSSP